jgi:DMSO/TMAO reductase YedYZ molybdopterin-dependent catalytic subunit
MRIPAAALAATVLLSTAALAEESAANGVELAGAVEHPRTLSLADLQREPATTEAVYFSTGKGPVRGTYTGVLLWTLLEEAGIRTDPNVKNDIVHHTVTVTGADGYRAVLSAGEIDPEFGASLAVLAYAQDGQPFPAGPGRGFARLIIPGDKNAGRNVQDVVRIEVQ